jgi:hypothetical protein
VLPPTSTSPTQLPDSHIADYSQDLHIPRTPTYFTVHFVAHIDFIAGRHEMDSSTNEGQIEQCFLTMFRVLIISGPSLMTVVVTTKTCHILVTPSDGHRIGFFPGLCSIGL